MLPVSFKETVLSPLFLGVPFISKGNPLVLQVSLKETEVWMLRRLLPLLRQAHQQPVHAAKGEPLAHEPLTLREPQEPDRIQTGTLASGSIKSKPAVGPSCVILSHTHVSVCSDTWVWLKFNQLG